jgi:hypothetical protein
MPDAVANRKRQMRGAGNKPKWTNEASWPEAAEGLFSAPQVAVNPASNFQKTGIPISGSSLFYPSCKSRFGTVCREFRSGFGVRTYS